MKLTLAQRWLKRFYPVPAALVRKRDALAATILKWSGLWPKVLKRYGITRNRGDLFAGGKEILALGNSTCHLCAYFETQDILGQWECMNTCPIVQEAGKSCYDCGSGYHYFLKTGDPGPLLRTLRRALKRQKGKE